MTAGRPPLRRPASPRFAYAQIDGRIVRSWNGYLLWLTRSESELVELLIAAPAAGFAMPIIGWLDPTSADYERRVVDLPGLLARGVVSTQTRDGDMWVSLNAPDGVASAPTPAPESPGNRTSTNAHSAPESGQAHRPTTCPHCATATERVLQADVIGALLRARGGRWLLRSDAAVPSCGSVDRASSRHQQVDLPPSPARAPRTTTTSHRSEDFCAYSTSWRGGSADDTRQALLDLVDIDAGIIAGVRRGSGLPAAIPVWFAGPNRAFSTAHPSGLSWRFPGNAMGKGLTDDEAQLSALAEAAERWSGTWQPSDGTADVGGRDLASGEDVEVPSDLVYMGHPPVAGHVRHTDTNGLAAGVMLADAQLQALLEIIERDAISAWWDGETLGTALALASVVDEALQPFVEWLEWLGLRVDLRHLPSLPGTTTLLAVGWLPGDGRWLYGAGTHIDPAIAGRRAVLELVQSTAAALATPKQVAPGRGIPAGLQPQPHEDPVAAAFGPLLTPWSRQPQAPQPASVAVAVEQLAQSLAAQGRRTVALDVTRAEAGVPVARVVVEGQRAMPLPMR